MKILVIGGTGKVGMAIAWDLVQAHEVEQVGIIGRNEDSLEMTRSWINSDKVQTHVLDVNVSEALKQTMDDYDVGILSLPNRCTNYKVVETAIQEGLNIVDILEEYHRRPSVYETEGLEVPDGVPLNDYGEWLHNKALENDVVFLDGIGFAPGLSNITLGDGISKLDKADSAIARVGGIPSKDAAKMHPLRFMITSQFGHVLREYMVKLKIIRSGMITEVDAMSEYETFKFKQFGLDEEFGCFITPGMPSFLYSRPHLNEFVEKTIRWPGHFEGVQTLKDCGLLDLTPKDFSGVMISPREFLLSTILPRLQPNNGETDICVMYNTVIGEKNGEKRRIDYYMWEEADTENNISSMARVTGFSAAIGAKMIGSGEISEKGIVPPEDAISGLNYIKFLKELRNRNINILEVPMVM